MTVVFVVISTTSTILSAGSARNLDLSQLLHWS